MIGRTPVILLALCAALFTGAHAPAPTSIEPDSPAGYQAAAEDLLADGHDRLAREVLATGLLVAAETDPRAAAGMAILLASTAESADDHAGLWSLAVTLDPARADDQRWLAPRSAPTTGRLVDAAETLTLLRQNDPDSPDRLTATTTDLIIERGASLGFEAGRVRAVLSKWETDARNDPCQGRSTRRTRLGDTFVNEACPDESYHHGTRIDSDWRMMVAIELSLSGATPSSWATALTIGLDPPVPAWSLATVGQRYSVSPDRPVYRAGRWVGR